MFISKLNILLFVFLFVLFCMGNYIPTKFMIGLLLLHPVITNIIDIIRQKEVDKMINILEDKNGK